MGNLDDALAKFAKRHGITRQLEASDVVEKATAEIAKFIDRDQFEVISFKDGVLKIGVNSSSAKNELNLKLGFRFKNEHGVKRVVFTDQPPGPYLS